MQFFLRENRTNQHSCRTCFALITHLLSTQTTKSWKMLMNNKFKAQSLNRKSYQKFTSCFSVTCFKHVGLLWPISALDRKQVRGYAFECPTWMRYVWANWHVPIQTYGHQTTLYISLNSTGEYVCIFEHIQYMHVNSRIYISYTCDAYRYAGMCIHTMSACVFVLNTWASTLPGMGDGFELDCIC